MSRGERLFGPMTRLLAWLHRRLDRMWVAELTVQPDGSSSVRWVRVNRQRFCEPRMLEA